MDQLPDDFEQMSDEQVIEWDEQTAIKALVAQYHAADFDKHRLRARQHLISERLDDLGFGAKERMVILGQGLDEATRADAKNAGSYMLLESVYGYGTISLGI